MLHLARFSAAFIIIVAKTKSGFRRPNRRLPPAHAAPLFGPLCTRALLCIFLTEASLPHITHLGTPMSLMPALLVIYGLRNVPGRLAHDCFAG